MRTIRLFMLVEAIAFAIASLIHHGLLVAGYAHHAAGIAEGVICAILVIGLFVSWIRPTSTYGVELLAQSLALIGTLVGIFTIILGVGPRTVPDVAYHIGITIVLIAGIMVTVRARRGSSGLS